MQREKAIKYLWLILAPALFLVLSAPSHQDYIPPHSQPGPATDTINFNAFAVEIASRELEAGGMDMYVFSLKTPAAEALQGNDDITVYEAPATMVDIVLNPAPAPEGQLNPLSIKEVRQALQHVVNRPFVAQEIYKGFALPMLTHVSPADFDLLTVYDLIKESNIAYDPQLASEMVNAAMTSAGAELKDGFWNYNGQRIDLKFIVRTEDERRDIGNAVAAEMNKLGFFIKLNYSNFGPAIFTVYATDPLQFQWHLYTEGWGRGAPQRYDFATLNQMCASWLGNMPGWQEVGYWQYEAPLVDELGQRLFTGDFKGIDERNEIYVQATEACLEESVRLWIATAVNNFPASSKLKGVTEDVVSGPKSLWTLREAYIPDETELTVGNLWVSTSQTTWNPVGGFGDIYSIDIWRNLNDPPMTNDPFTGLPIPFRAEYEVETAGPDDKLDLPAKAFAWNAETGGWSIVPAGTRATSKVTFDYSKYFQSKWHDGQSITMADVLYPIARLFDMVYNEDKAQIEFSMATTNKPFTDTIRGFRITSDDKLEVYVDFWHFIDDYIAQYASVSGVSMPWEVSAAMEDLVFNQRKAAYSDTSASRFSVPWINLVVDNDARLVRNTLRDFAERSFVPEGPFTIDGESLVDAGAAATRYAAAMDWFSQKGHMVISNGAYYLETFRGGGEQFAQIKAFRDSSYPFHPGDLYRGKPPAMQIGNIQKGTILEGTDSVTIVDLEGPGELAVRYVLQDPATGQIVKSGQAEAISTRQFQVKIPAAEIAGLSGDLYHLFLAAYSDELSVLLERRLDIEVGVAPQEQPTPTNASVPGETPSTGTAQPTAQSSPTPTMSATEPDGDGGTSVGLIIGIILAVAAGLGGGLLLLVMRSNRSQG